MSTADPISGPRMLIRKLKLVSIQFLSTVLVLVALLAPVAAAEPLRLADSADEPEVWVPGTATAADARDDFRANPRLNKSWLLRGTWAWSNSAKNVTSGPTGTNTALWQPGRYYCGAFSVKMRMNPARTPPKVTLIFAYDKVTKAYRYVRLTAGSPGSVTVGQTGTIQGLTKRTFKTVKTTVRTGVWNSVGVVVDGGRRVTVSLNGRKVTQVTIPKLPLGQAGIMTTASKVTIDNFVFVNTPDGEPCRECHAGQSAQAPAPNVYAYWDGTWWDRNRGGGSRDQQGGHGDPGGKPALTCTGTNGCHSMRLPNPGAHRNGLREGISGGATVNSFHLRAEYINNSPSKPWDVQSTFDKYCFTACHQRLGMANMQHVGVSRGRNYTQLGYGLTDPQGANIPSTAPLDSDVTSKADPAAPLFAPCVTCHDPHGTSTDAVSASNRMLRLHPNKQLCSMCHR